MNGRPERPCVPIEVELQPLHRPPPGTARLRRELRRQDRPARRTAATRRGDAGGAVAPVRRAMRRLAEVVRSG